MTITWSDLLEPEDLNVELRDAARSGGVSLSGQEQRVFSPAARWEVTEILPLFTAAEINAYRAMMGRLRQGEDIIVKVFDPNRPSEFGGDTGELLADVANRATTLNLDGVALVIEEGQHLSIGGDRLHLVTGISGETSEDTGLVLGMSDGETWDDGDVWIDDELFGFTVTITPPTRAAYAAGTVVQFDDLRVRCVIRDVNDGDIGLSLGRLAQPTITFVETIT